MKNLFLTFVLILAACTKNPAPVLQNAPQPYIPADNNFVMELAPSVINLEMNEGALGGSLADFSESINFNDIYSGARVSKRITISAKSDIPILDISAFRTAQTFLFKDSNCQTALQRLRSCVIDVEFIAGAPGPISEMISINTSLNFLLEGNVLAAIPVSYDNMIQLSEESIIVAEATAPMKKIIYAQNTTKKEVNFTNNPVNFNGLTVLRNSCNGILKPLRYCFFELSFTAAELNTTKSTFVTVLDKALIVKLGPQVPGSNLVVGSFIDGFIAGVRYTTPSYSGVTDADGTFNCNANETVSFYLGTMLIGSIPCGSVISPIELATNSEQNYQTEISSLSTTEQIEVTNLARLLQTLDNDGNPDNGIVIDPAVATKMVELLTASGSTIDSLVNSGTFSAELSSLTDQINTSLSETLIPVSIESAIAHFDDTRFQTVACVATDVPNSITVSGVKPNCAAASCQANYNLIAGECQPTVQGLTVTEIVNLGDFNGISKTATATISNTTNAALEVRIAPSTLATEGFSYSTKCPAPPTALRKNSSCQITISYLSSSNFATDTLRTEKLTVNGAKAINISVNHKGAPPQAESATFLWITNPLNFGTVNTITSQTVAVKNNATTDLNGLVFNSLPTGLTATTTCRDGFLRKGASCNVQIQIDPTKMYNGPFSYEYTYSNYNTIAKLKINATIEGGKAVPEICSSPDAQTNGWDTTNSSTVSGMKSGTDVSKCVIATCSNTYSLDIYGKTCVLTTKSCTVGSDEGTQTWNGNVYGACSIPSQTCQSNHTMINGSCQPTPCVITDVNFSTSVIGTKVSGCQATACQSNYSLANGQCQAATPIACSMTNAAEYGVITGNVVAVSGNTPVCIVSQCNSGFQPSPDQKSCIAVGTQPVSCDMTNAAANGITILDVASVSGIVPSCVVASCLNNKQPSPDQKSCITPVVSCDLTNAAANGINILDVASVSGNVPSCLVSSCLNGKQPSPDQKSCIMPVVACDMTNSGANGVNMTDVGSVAGNVPDCLAFSCLNGKQLSPDQKSCVSPIVVCSMENAAANGIIIDNVMTISGDVPSCTVTQCASGYQVSTDQKSCVSSSVGCTLENASSHGINLNNVIEVSGTTPSCFVEACSVGTQVSEDSKFCETPTVKLFGTLDKVCSIGLNNELKCIGSYFYSAFSETIIKYPNRDVVRKQNIKSLVLDSTDYCWLTPDKNMKCYSQYGYKAGPAHSSTGYVRDYGLTNVKKIVTTATATCILTEDSRVFCIGSNSKYTAPNVISNASLTEAPLFDGAINLIADHQQHSLCAHYPSREVKCVNLYNGTNSSNDFRIASELGTPYKIKTGSLGVCAFNESQNLKCAGGSAYLVASVPYSPLTEIPNTQNAIDYSGGCLKFSDGVIKCASTQYENAYLMNDVKQNQSGLLIEVPGLQNSTNFIGTRSLICGVLSNGETHCLGMDKLAAISPNSEESHVDLRAAEISWNGTSDSELYIAGDIMCYKNLSSGQYSCSGNNSSQVISTAKNPYFMNLVEADRINSLGLDQLIENPFDSGGSFGIINNAGQLSFLGQVGHESHGAQYSESYLFPVNFNNPVKSAAYNTSGMCLIDTLNNVYCAGETDTWNTGLPMNIGLITTPTYVTTISDAKKIVANPDGYCILTNSGSVYCAGNNTYEKSLPLIPDVVTDSFTQVTSPVPLSDIQVGRRYFCGMNNTNLYCGGTNYFGGYGDVHYSSFELVDTKGLSVKNFSPADWGLCFVATNGKAYCKDSSIWFGGNDYTYDPYYEVPGVIGVAKKIWHKTDAGQTSFVCVQTEDLLISCAGSKQWVNFGTGHNYIITPIKIWDQF